MENDEKKPEIKASEEPPKPKIVRNREVDRAAKELADDHVLPLPPGKLLGFDQMQEYLALLTPAMWSHVSVYLYRVKPKIRRQLRDSNLPNYIDCLGEPFTMDYFTTRHGGGKYQIQCVDTEGKAGNLLFKCFFEINDVQYPPILNYEELELDARDNKSYIAWLQNKGILDAKGNVITQAGQAPPSTAANMSAKDILDILGFAQRMSTDQQAQFRAQFAPGADSLSKSVGDILLEKMKQDDPGKDWDRMMTFMEKINKPDSAMPAIIQLMQAQIASGQEQRKTDLAYLQMLLDSQKHEASPRNQFGELREILGLARELVGTGGGRRSGWETGLEIARDVALPAIQSLGATITNIMSLRNGAAPVAPGQPGARPAAPPAPVAPFDPYRNPAAARQWASQQPQPAPGQAPGGPPPPPPPPGQPQAPDPEAQLLGMLRDYGGLIVNHMNNNTPGFDFADYVAGLIGTGLHAQISAYGENALVGAMLKIQEIAVFGEPRIRTFVNEFIHYEEFIQAQGQEEEPPEESDEPPTVEMPKFYKPHGRAATATREGA